MKNWRRIEECARSAGGAILLTLGLFVCGLSGCATSPVAPGRPAPLHGHTIPSVEIPDFYRVTPEMQAFLDHWVPDGRGDGKRAFGLAWAITDRNLFNFDYEPAVTLTPADTFTRGTGNCLSFSLMFVAMARHLGLDVWYQEVELPPQWKAANNTLLVSMHINVVLEANRGAWVIDVSGVPASSTRHLRRLDDHEAHAQYLNNLGAQALTDNDLATAYAYFTAAIELAPRLSYVWSNLGVAYNRNGQIADARAAHQAALAIDPGNGVAANNLLVIYEQAGDLESAKSLQARVDRHRRRNPYYLYYLSAEALEQGRIAESRELLEKAIEMKEREYRFHYELARTLLVAGDIAAAQLSLNRALALAPENVLAGDVSLKNLPALVD